MQDSFVSNFFIYFFLLCSQAFVLGIQFDIGNKDASARKMKMIDDLFRALPDSVVASPSLLRPTA